MNFIKNILFILFLIYETVSIALNNPPHEEEILYSLACYYSEDPEFILQNGNISAIELTGIFKKFIDNMQPDFNSFVERVNLSRVPELNYTGLDNPSNFATLVAVENVLFRSFFAPIKELKQYSFIMDQEDVIQFINLLEAKYNGRPINREIKLKFIKFYTSLAFWEDALFKIIEHIIKMNDSLLIGNIKIPFPEQGRKKQAHEIFSSLINFFNINENSFYFLPVRSAYLNISASNNKAKKLLNIFRAKVNSYKNDSYFSFLLQNNKEDKILDDVLEYVSELEYITKKNAEVNDHAITPLEVSSVDYYYHLSLLTMVDNWLRHNIVKESVFIENLLGVKIYKSFMRQFSNHEAPTPSVEIEIKVPNRLISAWLAHIKVPKKQRKRKTDEFISWLKHNKDALKSFNLKNAWLSSTNDREQQDSILFDFVDEISKLKGIEKPVKKVPKITPIKSNNEEIVKNKRNKKRKPNKTALTKKPIERTSFVQPAQPGLELPKGGEKPKKNNTNKTKRAQKIKYNLVSRHLIEITENKAENLESENRINDNKEALQIMVENHLSENIDNKENLNNEKIVDEEITIIRPKPIDEKENLTQWIASETEKIAEINKQLKDKIWERVQEVFNLVRAIKKEIPVLKNGCELNQLDVFCLSDEIVKSYNNRFASLVILYETVYNFKPTEHDILISDTWQINPQINADDLYKFNDTLKFSFDFNNKTDVERAEFLEKAKEIFFAKRATPWHHIVNQGGSEVVQRGEISSSFKSPAMDYVLFSQQPFWIENYSKALVSFDTSKLNFEKTQMSLFDAELWLLEKSVGSLILALLGEIQINCELLHCGISSLDLAWLTEWLEPFSKVAF